MANKFKVGDRIRAIDNYYVFTNSRNAWEGEVIRVISETTITVRTLKTKIRPTSKKYIDLTVSTNHFELISTPEIHITVKGNETIAVYRNGTEYKKAVAKCSPEDTFDFGIGAKLALKRLGVLPTEPKGELKEIKEEPKYYNGKVVCVRANTPHWTVGKIYEVKDGIVYSDEGWKHPRGDSQPYKDVEDIRHIGGNPLVDIRHNPLNEFIPLIEDEPNEPLTTEELKKMDGQRVWVLSLDADAVSVYDQEESGGWATVHNDTVKGDNFTYCIDDNNTCFGFRAYRKPLEGYEE